MANEFDFKETIKAFKEDGKKHTFAELIHQVWGGKIIEVYIGDTYEDIKYDDSTQKYVAILVGKVIDAYGECLIMNCAYVDQASKTLKYGNIVCLNERSVRTITEVDETGILKDTFLSSRDSKIVKDLFSAKK